MTKKILAIAIAICAACGISASAQVSRGPQPGDNNKMYQPRTFTEFAFEGILLDQAQQVKIDSINAALMANCQKPECDKANCDKDKAECKKDCKKDKADCKKDKGECKKDKTECKKECKKDKAECKRGPEGKRAMAQNAKQEYIKSVKEVLTPEQYTIFLENIVTMQDQQGPRMGHGNGPRPEQGKCPNARKDGKPMMKANAKAAKEKKNK